jgi:tetratricopeptide (TPR) repeat protein
METLYNNRAAMYEKSGLFEASLGDCAWVLATNPGHVKVRNRRSRIYKAQGRLKDSLVECCAVMVAEQMAMKAELEPWKSNPAVFQQKYMKWMEDKSGDMQKVQEAMQEMNDLCGKAKAEEVIKAREAAGGVIAAPTPGAISSESSVFQLLLSYTEYLDLEEEALAADVEALSKAVMAANAVNDDEGSPGASARAKMGALKARALHSMAIRDYSKASDDLMAAYSAFLSACGGEGAVQAAADAASAEGEGASAEKDDDVFSKAGFVGEAAVEACGVLRWVALFHHVKYDLEGALSVYRVAARLGASHPPSLGLVEIMRSGVYVDKGDIDAGEVAVKNAAALCPDSVDVLMHRSQLLLLKPDSMEESEADIRACVEKKPDHVVAQLRLAMLLISQAQQVAQLAQQGQATEADVVAKLGEAEAAVEKAKALRPKMSEVYQVTGSVLEVKGDAAGAMAAHEKAISLDPKNPTPYINKGMLLAQTSQPTSSEDAKQQGEAIMAQYEMAVTVDPLSSQAHKLLAEVKLRLATTFDETERIVADLEKAILNCRAPDELQELCAFSCVASAQLEAARDLGLSSFAEMGM